MVAATETANRCALRRRNRELRERLRGDAAAAVSAFSIRIRM
ncbi:MAG: hypothetical protein AABZ10_06190 [Nitrospirota bacterium]